MIYAFPGETDSLFSFKPRYENYIGGEWVAPVSGRYFENTSPLDNRVLCEIRGFAGHHITHVFFHFVCSVFNHGFGGAAV